MVVFMSRVLGRGEGVMMALQRSHSLLCLRSPVLSRLESCTYTPFPHGPAHQIFLGLNCDVRRPVTLISKNRGYRNLLPKILSSRNAGGQSSESGPNIKGFVYDHQGVDLVTKSFHKAVKLVTNLLNQLLKFFLVALGSFLFAIAVTPSLLSTNGGLQAAVYLTNKVVPGHIDIESLSLGWTKPIILEEFCLKDGDGDKVLSLSRLETKASLWSLVKGKAGLGDCTITSFTADLQEEKDSGFSKLALSVVPPNRLPKSRRQAKALSGISKKRKMEPAIEIMLSASIRAPDGGLEAMNGKVLLPGDIACVLGKTMFLDIYLGKLAIAESEELSESYNAKIDGIPVKAGMWSDFTQAEGLGFINLRKMELELIKPIKVEMDLNPKVGQLYLSRINPLLGEIVGPIVQEDDMPDVIMHVFPENLVLPTQEYKLRFEPMKAILARGLLAGGILSLLSSGKQDIAQGRKEVTLQTSTIEADIHMDGNLRCSRIDFLIAEKVHVATWGLVDWIDETVQMTLAIPGTTLRNVLGLSNLSQDYYLQIPIGGTFEQPQVDWKSAGIGVAQLTLQQRSGGLLKRILSQFDGNSKSVPEPVHGFPWISAVN